MVFLENWDGKFKKVTFELASYAAALAEMLGTTPVALSVGTVEQGELEQVSKYGIARILSAGNPELNVLDNQAFAAVIPGVAQPGRSHRDRARQQQHGQSPCPEAVCQTQRRCGFRGQQAARQHRTRS
ncbi:MAG: hypothetical protein MZU84_01425 [Sphingobacterium sp.]|nr:hypothetical protein [Sphingobacterium sp.]